MFEVTKSSLNAWLSTVASLKSAVMFRSMHLDLVLKFNLISLYYVCFVHTRKDSLRER